MWLNQFHVAPKKVIEFSATFSLSAYDSADFNCFDFLEFRIQGMLLAYFNHWLVSCSLSIDQKYGSHVCLSQIRRAKNAQEVPMVSNQLFLDRFPYQYFLDPYNLPTHHTYKSYCRNATRCVFE